MPAVAVRLASGGAIALAWLLLTTAPAGAQSAAESLEAGRAALEEAAFDDAVRHYDAAAGHSEGLDREQLLTLLRSRALAHHAARSAAAAEADVLAMLSLDPQAELGSEAPPSLREVSERLRQQVSAPLSLRAEAVSIPDGFEIWARPSDDVASLVRAVRVQWLEGETWELADDLPVRVLGSSLTWFAEALGPGGAVVARVGSAEEPEEATPSSAAVTSALDESLSAERTAPAPQSDDTGLHLGLVIGAVVAVAAAVGIALAIVFTASDQTTLGAPMEVQP